MDARIPGDLGVKRDRQDVALAYRNRTFVELPHHLDPLADVVDPRRADEHAAHGTALHAVHVDVRLEAPHLAPERVAAGQDVHDPEVLAVEHDHPGARPEDRPG